MAKKHKLLTERMAIRQMLKEPGAMKQMTELMKTARIGPPEGTEDLRIICVKWGTQMILGCVRDTCETCGTSVSLAPSTQEMMSKHKGKLEVIYMGCFVKMSEEELKA